MAQTSGWLIIAATKFTRMPFLAAVKEAKLRSFVTPGQQLALSAKLLHEGSGFAVTQAEIRCDGKLVCNAELTFRVVEFPEPGIPRPHGKDGERSWRSRWERWRMADAPREAWITGIGIVSCLGEGAGRALAGARRAGDRQRRHRDLRALRRASARAARSRQADPQEGRSAPDGAVAAHRHLRGRPRARHAPASRATPTSSRAPT